MQRKSWGGTKFECESVRIGPLRASRLMPRTAQGWSGLLLLALVVLSLVVLTSGAVLADSSGVRLYNNQCSSCHGPQGEGNVGANAPALAGLDAPYLLRQLQHFRDGVRGAHPDDVNGAVMRGSVRALGDTSLRELVEAIQRFPLPKPALVKVAGADLTAGRNYYNGICSACHGGKAEGIAALNAPKLSGQHPDYLTRQFLHFRDKVRGGHPADKFGLQMTKITKALPDEKLIHDVSAYIAQLAATP